MYLENKTIMSHDINSQIYQVPCSSHLILYHIYTRIISNLNPRVQIELSFTLSTPMLNFSNHPPRKKLQRLRSFPISGCGTKEQMTYCFCDMIERQLLCLIHKSHILLGLTFSIAVYNSIGYRIIIYCCDCTINFNTLYRSHKYNIVYKA